MDDTEGFRRLAGLLPEAMMLVRGDGQLVAGNAAAHHLLGQAVDSLPGPALDTLVMEPAQLVAEYLRTCARSRSFIPFGLTLRQGGGPGLPLRCEGAALRPRTDSKPAVLLLRLVPKAEGAAQFLLLKQRVEELSSEIHRRRRAEAALAQTTEHYRVTLASIGDGVIATDRKGCVEFMNPVAEELTGWSMAEARGRHLDEVFVIVQEDTREVVESPVAKVQRLGTVVGLANHTVLIRRDGSARGIDDSGAPIRGADGSLDGVVLVFRDLTERQALQRELLSKTARLEEADRRKDEFLSMLAHELRNPLAPLRSGIELLTRRHGHVEEVGPLAELMQRQVEHMTRLVDDLLDVARLTRGRIGLRKGPVDLAEAVGQAVEMGRPMLQARGLDVVVRALPPMRVEADLTRMVQVFANLLSNACKFSVPGGTVEVGGQLEGGQAAVWVSDRGAGIEPQLLPHVFDLFVQGDHSLDRAQSGLGLGLTIAQSIVHKHGGTIGADSAGPGEGATFTVRLPLLQDEPQVPRLAAPVAAAQASAGLRILVVDDNLDAADSLADLLGLFGHQAWAVHDAHTALDRVHEMRPEVVVLDIGLPGMDGFQLARAIRAMGNPQPLLVAVSGYGDAQARGRGREAGIDVHLTKPVEAQALDEVIRQTGRPG